MRQVGKTNIGGIQLSTPDQEKCVDWKGREDMRSRQLGTSRVDSSRGE